MNPIVRVAIASAVLLSASAPSWADEPRPEPVSYAAPNDAPTGVRNVKTPTGVTTPLLVGVSALAGLGAGALINDNKNNDVIVGPPASP